MASHQTSCRATRVIAACLALLALCLWPVLDTDGQPAHHASASRGASHRSARGGVSRSGLALAGQATDDGLVIVPADSSAAAPQVSAGAGTVAVLAAGVVVGAQSAACSSVDSVHASVSVRPWCAAPGRAPPTV